MFFKMSWLERIVFTVVGVGGTLVMIFGAWIGNIILRTMAPLAQVEAVWAVALVFLLIAAIADRGGRGGLP